MRSIADFFSSIYTVKMADSFLSRVMAEWINMLIAVIVALAICTVMEAVGKAIKKRERKVNTRTVRIKKSTIKYERLTFAKSCLWCALLINLLWAGLFRLACLGGGSTYLWRFIAGHLYWSIFMLAGIFLCRMMLADEKQRYYIDHLTDRMLTCIQAFLRTTQEYPNVFEILSFICRCMDKRVLSEDGIMQMLGKTDELRDCDEVQCGKEVLRIFCENFEDMGLGNGSNEWRLSERDLSILKKIGAVMAV